MTMSEESGFKEIASDPRVDKINAVEPEGKERRQRVMKAPHMQRSKKEWYDRCKALEEQLNSKPIVSDAQGQSIANGLLSALEVLTRLPYTKCADDSKQGFGNSLAMASQAGISTIDPKYLPWVLVATSLSLLSMEAFGIKRKETKLTEDITIHPQKAAKGEPSPLPSHDDILKQAFDG